MEYPVSPTVWVMPTALLSVYDKAGIVEFAAGIHQLGWRVVSSGGTAKAIAAAGTPVTDLAELTGVPAILDHRVVTLHPKIHGGLLADPTKESHRADMAEYGIEAIDLVVCNLYPFASNPSIELIDIGGPAMVRAGGEEPRVRRRGRQPGGLQRGARRAPRRWRDQCRHQTSSGGRRVRPDRRLRRPDRDLVRRRRAARPHAPVADQGAVVALWREPSSERRPLSRRGASQLVGRRCAARRQGDELSQLVRHRSGVAARAAIRRAGVRRREARQSVRRRGQRRHHRRVRQGQRMRPGQRVRRHRRARIGRCPLPSPMRWRRCSPR